MKEKIEGKIALMKELLLEYPNGIVAGQINLPFSGSRMGLEDHWEPYFEFLRVTNGSTFGSIDFWSAEELEGKQYLVNDFPGGEKRWLVIGQLLYEPIVLEADTEDLRMFKRDGEEDGVSLGTLDGFLERIFSCAYKEIIPDGEDDEWWGALGKAGIR